MKNVVVKEFDSIGAFEKYINETPLNSVFRWAKLASSQTNDDTYSNKSFYKTASFPEALELLKHGWDTMAAQLETTLKLEKNRIAPKQTTRAKYDVAGFQASVPRYLQGLPDSMINKKPIQMKQKVITVVKHIGYLGNVTSDTIIENSIKALMIVKKLEALGYRVNLDVMSPAEARDGEIAVARIRIKNAAERMNISKVAFPMVHSDMLRRMVFRFREVCPELRDKSWAGSYGYTVQDRSECKKYLNDGEYYLHNFIGDIDEEIKKLALK